MEENPLHSGRRSSQLVLKVEHNVEEEEDLEVRMESERKSSVEDAQLREWSRQEGNGEAVSGRG